MAERLQALTEVELQSRIIEPLLQASGFYSVRDISGCDEKLRTLTAAKTELGTLHRHAITITKFKRSDHVDEADALVGVLQLIENAIRQEELGPVDRSKHAPDRISLITPFAVSRSAFDAAVDRHQSRARIQISVMDSSMLASEVLRLIPHVAAALNETLAYRVRLAEEQRIITESRSFGIQKPFKLEDIFIEADYTCFDDLRSLLVAFLEPLTRPDKGDGIKPFEREPCSAAELVFLAKQEACWAPNHIAPPGGPEPYALEKFIDSLTTTASNLVRAMVSFNSKHDHQELEAAHEQIPAFQAGIAAIRKTSILNHRSHLVPRSCFNRAREAYEELLVNRRLMTYRHLSICKVAVVITGVAGAGKTTLLRKLVTQAAEDDTNHEIVYARAVDIEVYGMDGVLRHLLLERNRAGGNLSPAEFNRLIASGSVRVMIDGLDEAGRNARQLAASILVLTEKFPACPIIITTRETVDLSEWTHAMHIKLCPFSEVQVMEFIGRWFSAQPTAAEGMKRWVRIHPKLKELTRTPLVTALMCSLYEAGEEEMPLSETDLYERRLDFLLGKWEQAKNIPSMPERARKRYVLFLMHLAHSVHLKEDRFFDIATALKLTPRFLTSGFNPNGQSMIKDCLGRGLFVTDDDVRLSFGHLAHQEFLVGKYMHKYNDLQSVSSRLGVDWWRRPLMSYASLIGDISPLLGILSASAREEHQKQIKELIEVSGDTPDPRTYAL